MIEPDDICDKCQDLPAEIELPNGFKVCSNCATEASGKVKCEKCGKIELKKDIKSLQCPHSTLQLCQTCYEEEIRLACMVDKREEEKRELPAKHLEILKDKQSVELLDFPRPNDSNVYQKFFTETSNELAKLENESESDNIERIRNYILKTQEELFGLESELFIKKTKKQAAVVTFNNIISKLSKEEREKLKIEELTYKPEARELKSPILTAIEKKKKIAKTLEEKMIKLFGEDKAKEMLANLGVKK